MREEWGSFKYKPASHFQIKLCSYTVHQDSIFKPTLFHSLKIGREEDGRERVALHSHSRLRENKEDINRIKIVKVIFEESPTVANQLPFYREWNSLLRDLLKPSINMLCMYTVYKELTVFPTPGTPNTHIFPNHHLFFLSGAGNDQS